jgi:hypothetical protein
MRIHRDTLELDLLMDHGWIATYGSSRRMSVQVSFASEGGTGTPVPNLSIEVDDVDEAYAAMRAAGFDICYGRPTNRGAYVVSMFATRSEPHTAWMPFAKANVRPSLTCDNLRNGVRLKS